MTASTQIRPLDPRSGFSDFVASRPDEEKWELIEGRFVMQAQPNFHHQIIAGTLERLLNDSLARIGAARIALQNPAVDLSPSIEGHTYVPDVAILDLEDIVPDRNVTGTCYLAAEIVSGSDRRRLAGTDRRKIAVKLAGYEALATCEAVLIVEQRAVDVTLSLRTGGVWGRTRLTGPEARLTLPAFGLDCRLADLYARTGLVRAVR